MEYQPITKNTESIAQVEYSDPLVRESVKKITEDYSHSKSIALDTLDPNATEGPVRGSNIYFRNKLIEIYRQLSGEDVLPITQTQSEIALANDTLIDPKETYEDTGLAIYPEQGYNEILWKHLRDIASSNEYKDNLDLKLPFIVTGLLNVTKDDSFEYSLRLDPTEHTLIYNVPALAKGDGSFNSNDPSLIIDGFPSFLDSNGDRNLWTESSGALRLYRGRNSNLNARGGYLDDSDDAGRVHVAKNSSGNIGSLVEELEQEQKIEKEKLRRINETLEYIKNN
ncbi:hypothetical protein CL617_04130 [archaeon]|nr:hypothetical protein [archaeon]|tara:strand:- start:12761 stop:13606 length:846 start_codon:yes stop_codon:yes gene_type:complete